MNREEQQKQWDRYKKSVKNNELIVEANAIRSKMAMVAMNYAGQHQIHLPYNSEWDAKLALLRKALNRSKRLIDAVASETLGIRFVGDDIDIMAPAGMSDDEIAEYQTLGWILIAVGIVVVASVIAHSLWVQKQNEELRVKFNNLLYVADNKFCANPESNICKNWINRKKQENFTARKGTIEMLEDGIVSIGQTIKKGAGIGLMIAIPLLAWAYFGKRR